MVKPILFMVLCFGAYGCKTDDSIKSDSQYSFFSQASLVSVTVDAAKNPGISKSQTGSITGQIVSLGSPGLITDKTKTVVTFQYAGDQVTVGGSPQTSGVTVNNFTTANSYKVTAFGGGTTVYSVAFNPEISSFTFKTATNSGFTATRTASFESLTAKIGVPQGVSKASLIADFVQSGSSLSVAGTKQTSGVTANNFTQPVVYHVVDAEGRASDYTVTAVDFRKRPDTGQTTSHTTTPGEDNDYVIHGLGYTDGSVSITDKNTGLVWQKADDNTTRSFENAALYCSSLSIASLTNWRLPEILEIFEFIDAEKNSPAINGFCSSSTNLANYWSNTSSSASVSQGWAVDFDSGNSALDAKTTKHYVRCVSGTTYPKSSYMNNGNNTVTDHSTGLSWIRSEASSMSWESALNYCEGLSQGGYTDWRLPNIKSLRTLIDFTTQSPAVNKTYFPQTQSKFYWSSTTYNGIVAHAWYVDFASGAVSHFLDKISKNPVRCVRGGI